MKQRIHLFFVLTAFLMAAQTPPKAAVDPMKLTMAENYALQSANQTVAAIETQLTQLQQRLNEARQLRDALGRDICTSNGRQIVGQCKIENGAVVAVPDAPLPVPAKTKEATKK